MKNNVLLSKINFFYKKSRINVDSLKPLEKYITDENNPTVFFTMTMVNKVGINPQSKYNTPLGVCAYPLTSEFYNLLLNNNLPFVSDMPYINVFSVKKNLQNVELYTQDQKNNDLSKLNDFYDKNEITKILNDKRIDIRSNISEIWYLTYKLASDPKKWNFLLRKLGYDGVYDPGTGTIHPNEPTQAIILNPSIINPIETFYNPHTSFSDVKKNLTTKEDFKMFENKNINFKRNLERNKFLNIIEKLKTTPINFLNYDDLLFLASNKKTSPEILEQIAKYNISDVYHSDVLVEIARREDITEKTIEYISDSSSSLARSIIASNHKLSKDIILKFMNDNNLVRELLVENKNLPIEFIKILANDESFHIREKAKEILKEKGIL